MSFVCADLSEYREQLARERNARTLTLRRGPITIAQFLGRVGGGGQTHLLPKLDATSSPFLEPEYAMQRLRDANPKALADFFNNLVSIGQKSTRLAVPLMRNSAFQELFVSSISSSGSDDVTILLAKYFVILFPLFPDMHEPCIDFGLCYSFFDMFNSQNPAVVGAVIALIDCIAEASGYARDSVLCLGLHTNLISVAVADPSESMTVAAVEALNKIFANRAPIDSTTLTLCLEPMAELLNLSYVSAVNVALSCFISMTNKMPALVFTMYELNLFPVIVRMLDRPELVEMALPLIGNLSVGHAQHIETLLECHLFEILMKLLRTEQYSADIYWVLSNLVESVPHLTIGFFDEQFVKATLKLAQDAGYEVKKESGFFIATLILFTEVDELRYFINAEVLDLMVQMLGCSVGLIVLRCLDALLRLAKVIRAVPANRDQTGLFQGNSLMESLTALFDQSSVLIHERAEFLLGQIEGFGADSPIAGGHDANT
jgi:hypothetical protein